MKAYLLRRTPVWWITMMFVFSFLVHSAIVGGGLIFKRPPLPPEDEGEKIRELIADIDAPEALPDETPPPPEPTPEPTPEDTPEPTPDATPPDFTDATPPPDTPPPTPRPSATPRPKPSLTPVPPGTKRGPVPQTGIVNGSRDADAKPPGPKPGGGTWSTPKPAYPYAAKKMRLQGSGGVRVTTDSTGRVISASMSPGIHPMLDSVAISYARSSWKGPPNTTKVVPITFVLE